MRVLIAPAIATLALMSGLVHAHGSSHQKQAAAGAEQTPFGIAGDPKTVSRTVVVTMSDAMRFSPAMLEVKLGETVKFVVKNDGELMHEMVIGTLEDLKKHAELMQKFPDMEHGEPHMAHVNPGASEELIWRFNRPGEFHFGCLIAGHFEAGMIGKIVVSD